MIKYFCDKCGAEIVDSNSSNMIRGRVGTTSVCSVGKKIEFEVLVTYGGTANAGCFCRYCILDALIALDNRPKCKVG